MMVPPAVKTAQVPCNETLTPPAVSKYQEPSQISQAPIFHKL